MRIKLTGNAHLADLPADAPAMSRTGLGERPPPPPHPSNLYRVDASPYILRQNSRFTVTTNAAITTVAPNSTAKLPASVARLITAPSPTVEYVVP